MSSYFQRLAQRGSGVADSGLQLVRPVPSLYGRAADAAAEAGDGGETAKSVETLPPPDHAPAAAPSLRQAPPAMARPDTPRQMAREEPLHEAPVQQKPSQPVAASIETEAELAEVHRTLPAEASAVQAAAPVPAEKRARATERARADVIERAVPSKARAPTLENLFDAIERPPAPPPEREVSWPVPEIERGVSPATAPEPPSVSIGRINITVAPPPAPLRTGPARTQGFRSYDALRRGLLR